MNKQSWIILFSLLILLIGCGPVSFENGEKERRQPIDLSQWPTPVPETVTPTPTPFPKITLAPTPTRPAATGESASTAATALDLSGNPAAIVEQITELTGGLTPVGVAAVTAAEATIYQQPSDTSDALETLSQGDFAAPLGQSEDGDWLYIITPSTTQGWIPANSVRMNLGSLSAAPVLAPDQLEPAAGVSNVADLLPLLENLDPAEIARQRALQEFAPVGVALVKEQPLVVQQGPGTSFGSVETLEPGSVTGILGKNTDGNWVYVVTITSEQGWLPLDGLRVVGDMEKAPVLPNNPVAAVLAQVAGTTSSATPVQPLDLDTLQVVASARVSNVALNLRQRPGGQYDLLDTLSEGDRVEILALNRDREWALLQTAGGQLGWGSLDYLTIDGSLADALQVRTLPPESDDQLAPLVPLSGGAALPAASVEAVPAAENSSAENAPATHESAIPTNTLAAVTSGKIIEKVDLRLGPSDSYGTIHTVFVDEPVTVRGVSPQGDWAIVEAPNNRIGWATLNTLTLDGSTEGAAAVRTGWIQSNDLEVKSGPGIYFDTVGKLGIDSMVSVLGINKGRNWLLVESLTGGLGWIPLRFVDLGAPLNDIPQVDEMPVAESSGSSVPAPSGSPTGKLVIQTSNGGDIMLINADGSGLQRLTNGIDPILSHDGQQVAFTRWEGDTGTLWVINTDGSGERPILGEMRKAKGPDWSADDSQIALNYQHGGRLEIKVICEDLAGGFPNIPRNAIDVGVKRDGNRIQVCITLPPDEQWGLRVVNLADGSFEDLYGGLYAFRPAWDPGQPWRIVSDSGDGLLGVDINRPDFRQPLTDNVGDGSPVFSPDGRFIALATDVQGGRDIFRMNPDGSGRVRLTQTPLWVPVQPDSNSQQWNNVAPAWSPDGSRIAFLTDRTGRWEVWLMNADGSNQQPMFSNEINDQLEIAYNFVDERGLSWR